jgi:mono/diheme cytochrome c family protein
MFKNRRFITVIIFAFLIASMGITGLVIHSDQKISAEALLSDQTSAAFNTGELVYQQYCLACHAVDGHGNNGAYPDLVSDHFKKRKGTYEKAFSFISQNMPENAPGSLSEDQYNAVVKYLLSLNGIPIDLADIKGHWAQKEINYLFEKNYIDGYASGNLLNYKPDQSITRAEFIRYLVKSKQLFLSNDKTTDLIDITKSKDKVYIITAVEYGIIHGYPDHSFFPAKSITRAEIAAILVHSELLSSTASSSFSDVSPDNWASSLIGAVVQAKLFSGYKDGTFKPDSPITRGEAASVIYRLINPR